MQPPCQARIHVNYSLGARHFSPLASASPAAYTDKRDENRHIPSALRHPAPSSKYAA